MERQTDTEETEKGRLQEDGEELCEAKRYRDRDTLIERHGEIRDRGRTEEIVIAKNTSDNPYWKMGSFPRDRAQAWWALHKTFRVREVESLPQRTEQGVRGSAGSHAWSLHSEACTLSTRMSFLDEPWKA